MGTQVTNPVTENVSFTSQIGYYAGPTSSYSSEILQWLSDGVKDVIRKVSLVSPEKLGLFASTESFTASTGLELTTPYVFHVYAGSKTCKEIPLELRHQALDSSSIYFADAESPVFFISENKLFVLPSGVTDSYAEIVKYSEPVNSGTPSIDFFPEQFYPYVVLFVAANVLHAKMSDKLGNSDVLDCLTKAKDAIDAFKDVIDDLLDREGLDDDFKLVDKYLNIAFAYLTNWNSELIVHSEYNPQDKEFDFEAMQEDEDVELAQTAMQGATSQLSLAQALLGRIDKEVQVASMYPQAAQAYLSTAQNILGKDDKEYQWLMSQLAYVKQKYEEGFIPVQK